MSFTVHLIFQRLLHLYNFFWRPLYFLFVIYGKHLFNINAFEGFPYLLICGNDSKKFTFDGFPVFFEAFPRLDFSVMRRFHRNPLNP